MIVKEIIGFFRRLVMVYGLIMMATYFMCLVFSPYSSHNVVDFFGRCMLLALVSCATNFVYLSNHELSNKSWWIRALIQLAIVEITVMTIGYAFGFWYSMLDGVIYFSVILAVVVIWHILNYGKSTFEANTINLALVNRRFNKNNKNMEDDSNE